MGLRTSRLTVFECQPSSPKQASTSCWEHKFHPPYNHNWTDLHYAASQGDHARIKQLLTSKSGISYLNKKDYYGKTPLFWAAYKGHLHCMEVLLNAGAQVNVQCRHGGTPLHAVVSLYPECAILLIKHGADVNLSDNWGVSPMYLAATNAQLDIIRYLILAGAQLTYKNKKTGDIPKQLACHEIFSRYLHSIEHNTTSLQQLARTKIRRQLGEHPVSKIACLPLPTTIKDYLLLPELS